MSDKLHQINICDIDLNDLRYKISFSSDNIDFLASSIKNAGLINPPLVRPLENKYIIISGFNRVKALIQNHEKTIVVHLTKPDIDEYQCFLKSITALSFKRQLSHAELIQSIKKLNDFLDAKQIAAQSIAIFNETFSEKFVKSLLNIYNNLPQSALALIHQGNISIKTATRMVNFDIKIINKFLIIFSKIKASNNKQIEIVQYIDEITKRDAIKLEDFFQKQEILEIINDKNKEPVIKTRLLREFLYELRFPTLFKTRRKVAKKIKKFKLGNKIKFVPPDNFESQNYTVSFTLKNLDEFKANTKILTALSKTTELKEFFNK